MLKLNADGIMQMLEQDLTRITTWIENWKKQKDVSVVAQIESVLKST
jgi:plasmid stabilization system protein ParE